MPAHDATRISTATLASPLGPVHLAVHAGALCALGFDEQWPTLMRGVGQRFGWSGADAGEEVRDFTRALEAYFAGEVSAIDALAVDPGGTEFQQEVWARLRHIPAGRTASYAEIARRIGRPQAVRAVGMANARNPVSIVIPCHRVIAADGSLHGYGGGLDRKRWLLAHEGAIHQASIPLSHASGTA